MSPVTRESIESFTSMKKILRIGEFSKINNIPIRTLRFYDQINLLNPHQVDPETNYRLYHIEQSSIVDAIQYLRQLDFSLEEIKEILSDPEKTHIHRLIEEKYQQLLDEKQRLEKQIQEIEIFRSGALLYQENTLKTEVEIIQLPERQYYSFDIDKDIYQMNSEEYELQLRHFKQEILHYNPFFNHFSRIGSLMTKENFLTQNFYSNHFILFGDERIHHKEISKHSFPQGTYAVRYCNSFEEEIQVLPKFLADIKKKGYGITGDYICEVIHEQPNLNSQKRDMFIRMQVKVTC